MYKNYELSTMAKGLVKELKALGTDVPYAKALEIAARMVGSRTLHVQQVEDKPAKSLEQRAWDHVGKVLFHNPGSWGGKLDVLKGELDKLMPPNFWDLDQDEQDAWVAHAWEGPLKGVQFTYLAADLPVGDLSKTMRTEFERTLETLKALAREQSQVARAKSLEVAQVAASLASLAGSGEEAALCIEKTFGVSRSNAATTTLFEGVIRDWEAEAGVDASELTPLQREAAFEAKVTRQGSQLAVDIAPAHESPDDLEDVDQLGLVIEINRGRPSVHITNAVYGDMVLSVFASKDGLYLAPGDSLWSIRTGAPSGQGLRDIHAWQEEAGTGRNNAFIEAPLN